MKRLILGGIIEYNAVMWVLQCMLQRLHNSDKLLVLREGIGSEVVMGTRKDKKGRVLRTGESQRDKYYIYQYTDIRGKRRVIYAKDLPELRLKEKEVRRALEDGRILIRWQRRI